MKINFPDFYTVTAFPSQEMPFTYMCPPEKLLPVNPVKYPSTLKKYSWVNIHNSNTDDEVSLNPFQFYVLASIWNLLIKHYEQERLKEGYDMESYNMAMEGIGWFAEQYPKEYRVLLS